MARPLRSPECMSEQTLPNTGYEIVCRGCRQSFDAVAASWCDCVSPDRTLVCPRCRSCFCSAPHAFRRDFWEGAPPVLWTRKLSSHILDYEPAEAGVAEGVGRPVVLIVDDDRDIRRMAAEAAKRLECRVIVGKDGLEGLELVRRHRPSVVVTDALMPGLDGRELARQIKNGLTTAFTRVIVMTSVYTKPEDVAEAQDVFLADEILIKPIRHERFRRALARQLRASSDTREREAG